MTLQAPELLTSEGRSTDALQLGGRPAKKGTVLAVTDATARVILPVSSNTLPFAVYSITNDGSSTAYYALGDVTVTSDHVANGFDGDVAAGATETIRNVRESTYISAITVSGTANLIVAPYV